MFDAAQHVALFDLTAWDRLDSSDRLSLARAVALSLPAAFQFRGLEPQSLAQERHEVAFFTYKGASFALLPGGWAKLGHDHIRPIPNARLAADADSEPGGLATYLERHLSPVRVARLEPLLYEIEARPFEMLRGDHHTSRRLGSHNGRRTPGFRLPSSDEWEYACAAGSRTLFRWGDDWPNCRPDEANHWDLHCCPNAFGLVMNSNIHSLEICEGIQFRGGDAGLSITRGQSHFASWLPFASSYIVPDDEDTTGWCVDEIVVRRVWPLGGD